MKRFFYLILTLLLISFLVGVFSVGAWFLLTSDSSDLTYDTVMATVVKAGDAKPFVTEHSTMFKKDYRLVYTQYLGLTYTYEGKNYNQSGEFTLSTEYYDTKPVPGPYAHTYIKGSTIPIKVMKLQPEVITIEDTSSARDVSYLDIAKVAVPVWLLFVIITLVKFAKKSKQIRKQNFYKKMGMENYWEE